MGDDIQTAVTAAEAAAKAKALAAVQKQQTWLTANLKPLVIGAVAGFVLALALAWLKSHL